MEVDVGDAQLGFPYARWYMGKTVGDREMR